MHGNHVDLQTLATDRIYHDHLDFTPLCIWILLNTDFDGDRIKHANLHMSPTGLGDGDRVILGIECMSFFLECDQPFQTKSDGQFSFRTGRRARILTQRRRRLDHS